MFSSRIARLAAVALVVACAAVLLVRLLVPSGPAAPDFTLTDENGQPYTLSAHRGHPIALFFGYAHCPDVCPTTLAALAGFIVAEYAAAEPKRDSPPVLKRYVHLFDPSFTGLTGSESQLDPVYAAYHIVHEIDSTQQGANGYIVAHSSVVQFISPAGKLRGTGNFSDSSDDMAVLMKQALS